MGDVRRSNRSPLGRGTAPSLMILDKHGEAAVGPGWVRGFAGRFRIWRRCAAAGHRRESTSTPSTSKIAPLEYRHASSSQPPPGGPTVAAPGALNRAPPAP